MLCVASVGAPLCLFVISTARDYIYKKSAPLSIRHLPRSLPETSSLVVNTMESAICACAPVKYTCRRRSPRSPPAPLSSRGFCAAFCPGAPAASRDALPSHPLNWLTFFWLARAAAPAVRGDLSDVGRRAASGGALGGRRQTRPGSALTEQTSNVVCFLKSKASVFFVELTGV